jgi:putative transposase
MRRREIPGGIRFVTFSCQRRLPLLRNKAIAALAVEALMRARASHGLQVYAWVLMPEHAHILCRPASSATLERVLLGLKMSVAKRVLERWKSLDAPILAKILDATGRPRFWQKGGGFDRNVRDEYEFAREVRYIHRNPVERGLVHKPEDWPWSSVRWWMGRREGEFECDPPPGGTDAWAHWKAFT